MARPQAQGDQLSAASHIPEWRSIDEVPEGTPFEFRYRGRTYSAVRFKSEGNQRTYGMPNVALNGEFGRAILADALGRTLEDSLTAVRSFETESQRQARLAVQRQKSALVKEAMAAKSKPARKARW